MNKIGFESPRDRGFFQQEDQPLPASGVFHVVGVIASLFFTVGIWLIGVPSSLKDQVLDILPDPIAARLDPRRVFVHRILLIAPDQRGCVLKYALERISPDMDQHRRERLIRMVSNEVRISSLSRNILVSITPAMHSDSGIDTIDAIAKISKQERLSVITYSDQLMTSQSNGYSRKVIIEALLLVRSEEREEVMRNVLKIISPSMNAKDRALMIEAVHSISENQRDEVVSASLHVITSSMAAFERMAILRVLHSVSMYEREEVALEANRLIRVEMGYFSRTTILQALSVVKSKERTAIVDVAIHAITKRSSSNTIRNILEALNSVHPKERAQVMGNALVLMEAVREDQEGDGILRLIARLPSNERDSVANLACHAITRQMNMLSRIEIMKAIISVPNHERADVMQYAMILINHRMNGFDRAMMIRNVANIPFLQRADYVERRMLRRQVAVNQNTYNEGVNVHEGDRDQRTKDAVELLRKHQGEISINKMDKALKEFIHYLDSRKMDMKNKQLAYQALLAPKRPEEDHGPLISDEDFSILGLMMSGKEVIARLWIFASTLREPDMTNAKDSMISALSDSYYMKARVCNQGKTQRLLIGVLQGRLAGANIESLEEAQVPTRIAIQMFFNVSANRAIENLDALTDAANTFCENNPAVNPIEFMSEIQEYAKAQNMNT